MRVSRSEEDFEANFLNAQMESVKGFSDNTMYIERFVENPRHIEFQILGDRYGNVVHLGERDCSIQRRHQKVLEESPSAAISGEASEKRWVRRQSARQRRSDMRMREPSSSFSDKDKNFYFMEMNTRIQVEHPVTEAVTDMDLIKEQIRIAAGEPLSVSQEDIQDLRPCYRMQDQRGESGEELYAMPGHDHRYPSPGVAGESAWTRRSTTTTGFRRIMIP